MKFMEAARRRSRLGMLLACGTIVLGLTSQFALADTRDQAKRIHDRIAGVPPDEQMLIQIVQLSTDKAIAKHNKVCDFV